MAWANKRSPKEAASSEKRSITMRNKIRSHCKDNKITLKSFNELIGCSPTTMSRFLSGHIYIIIINIIIKIIINIIINRNNV